MFSRLFAKYARGNGFHSSFRFRGTDLHVMYNTQRAWHDGPFRFERWGTEGTHRTLILGRLSIVRLDYRYLKAEA